MMDVKAASDERIAASIAFAHHIMTAREMDGLGRTLPENLAREYRALLAERALRKIGIDPSMA